MGRIAFVFSGQGDQHPGMGKELAEQFSAAAKVYALCDQIRPGTSKQCFEGTTEELKETKNTQPCLFAMELAAAEVLLDQGIRPDALAGFSLGEVSASTAAGMFDLETGFRLVCKRGELMQAEAERFDASMVAVVRLTAQQVCALANQFSDVYPVNFNCPGQVTVSGLKTQMPAFCAAVKAAGGRALPLNVAGGFHSPFMQKAADAFAEELGNAAFQDAHMTLYSNVTGQPYDDDAVQLLSKQIANPVQWENTIRNMIHSGIDTFIEIGPGRTLTNMIRKIDPSVTAKTVMDVLEELPC